MLKKRIVDFVLALMGLIILLPVFLIIILFIKFSTPGPVFFCQQRVGQYQRLFNIHKFRTMIVNAQEQGPKITVGNDVRVTKIGRFLRKSKLDELPQLFDVLCGNMSLVGPRPEVPEYIRYYPEAVKQIVFKLKPGITDFASIKMIDESLLLANSDNPQQTYIEQILPEKLGYAVKYAKQQSLGLDLYLILLTITKIFTR